MKKLIATSSLLFLIAFAIALLWACNIAPEADKETFNLKGDTAWIACDTVTVVLLDIDRKPLDTLFRDKLKSLDQLSNLDASEYPGGLAIVHISGVAAGKSCFEQSRTFSAEQSKVKVDTLFDPATAIDSITSMPDSLILIDGGAAAPLLIKVYPPYADASIRWEPDSSGVVGLEGEKEGLGNSIRVKPLQEGAAYIVAHSAKHPGKSRTVLVRVLSKSAGRFNIHGDTVRLFLKGPEDTLGLNLPPGASKAQVKWSIRNPETATIDSAGRIKPLALGNTQVLAHLDPPGITDSALVVVQADIPLLTIASKTGAPINTPVVYSLRASQEYGSIVLFKWDVDGDGKWDDSLAGNWEGHAVDLPPQTGRYPKEGLVTVRFLVEDSEGNEGTAKVTVDVGNQAPEFLAVRADTVISIKDSIPMTASVRDGDGKVVWVGWDYEGDGKTDDSTLTDDSLVLLSARHAYPDSGVFRSVLTAKDESGKLRRDTVRIEVKYDRPSADVGKDTSVSAATLIRIHPKWSDGMGQVVKRELKVGKGDFGPFNKQDTAFLAPTDTGKLECVFRVIDDDGLSASDTLVVTITEASTSNADLSSLKLSAGALDPVFRPITAFYAAEVGNADSAVTITPMPSDPAAKILINGKTAAAGKPSDPVMLKVGTTVDAFQIRVTAQDGLQKTYTVSMTRLPSSQATLASLAVTGADLKPAFKPDRLLYSDTVPYGISSIALKPVTSKPEASLFVGDSAWTSGKVTDPLPLSVGENALSVTVTAQDGSTKAKYDLRITRRAKLLAYRKLGGQAATLTDSSEYLAGSTVSLSSPAAAGYHFSQWSLAEGKGKLADPKLISSDFTLESAVARLEATFAPNAYDITTSGNQGVKFTPDKATVEHGKDTSIWVEVMPGYRLASFSDNDSSVDPERLAKLKGYHSLKAVTRPHALKAKAQRIFTATANVVGNGKVDGLTTVQVDSAGEWKFNFLAGAGQVLYALTDNGVPVLAKLEGDSLGTATYTLAAVDTAHTVTASFRTKTYKLTVTGTDVCIKAKDFICGIACIDICLIAPSNSRTVDAVPGAEYVISTAPSFLRYPFQYWRSSLKAVTYPINPLTITVGNADETYSASYLRIIKDILE